MRIIAGEHKGRAIQAPKGQGTRPTGDRARESVFNMLAHAEWAPDIEGARVIDLFAGSGALGLEAMSRGAAFCLFVETDHAARGAIRDNIETLGLYGNTRLHRRSATDLGEKPAGVGSPFNLAFLDPPYHKELVAPALAWKPLLRSPTSPAKTSTTTRSLKQTCASRRAVWIESS